jgi:ATP-dependent helicase/nuclease subunit B
MDTPAGIFARLAAEAVADGLAPPTLLALLKHPLFRLGSPQGAWAMVVADLELALLRGTRPAPGSAGLARDFARFREELGKLRRKEASTLHASEPRAQLSDLRLATVQTLIERLLEAFKPLEEIKAGKPSDFSDLAERHRKVIIALSHDDKDIWVRIRRQRTVAGVR